MDLEPIYTQEEFESAPEGIRGLYKAGEDGNFRLRVKPKNGWDLQNVAGLSSALNKEKAAVKQLKQNPLLSAFGDTPVEELQARLAKLEELESMDMNQEVSKQVETRLRNATDAQKAQHNKELQALREKAMKTEAQLQKVLLDGELMSSLTEAGVKKEQAKVLAAYLRPSLKMDIDGSDYKALVMNGDEVRYNAEARPLSIKELVAEIKSDKSFEDFFEGRNKQGGGMPADSQGGMPKGVKKDPEQMSRKEKMAYMKAQIQQARQR